MAGGNSPSSAAFHLIYAIGFAGYVLFPAAGPVRYPPLASQIGPTIEGGFFTALNNSIVHGGCNGVDVFPSLHTAITLFVLLSAFSYSRRLAAWLAVPCALIVCATIGLQYHYAADLVAGALLGSGVWAFLAYRFHFRKSMTPIFVYRLHDPAAGNPALTGGKGSRLNHLLREGFPVPDGFVVTAAAYRSFAAAFEHVPAAAMGDALATAALPAAVEAEIRLNLEEAGEASFAVRSSSTMEDLAEAAFAGQHETFLNVRGTDAILEAVRQCFLSLWNERAVSYRSQRGFDHRQASMAVVCSAWFRVIRRASPSALIR